MYSMELAKAEILCSVVDDTGSMILCVTVP